MESLIVDANKVIASFITKGIVHELLFSGKFEPIVPEKLLSEVVKHIPLISAKSGIPSEELRTAIPLILFDFISIYLFGAMKKDLESNQ